MTPRRLVVSAFGVRIGLRIGGPGVVAKVLDRLPPGATLAAAGPAGRTYTLTLTKAGSRRYQLLADGQRIGRPATLGRTLAALEADAQLFVAERAPRRIFVHAGVVGWRGRAILLPGKTFAGKTTLVVALVRAGATYYSDEYAVLDASGRVHPYPRVLHVRDSLGRTRRRPIETLGGEAGAVPLPVGLIVASAYRASGRWRPRSMSPAESVLALLANTVPARARPEAVMTALQRAASAAIGMTGARGPAGDAARAILSAVAV